jgi:hypothetical protein
MVSIRFCLMLAVFLVLSLLVGDHTGQGTEKTIVIDDFESGLRPKWERKVFHGKTLYTVVPSEGGHCLEAKSSASASGLIYPIKYDVKEYPFLSWRWKVRKTLKKGDARKKEGDDYAARVYVVFPNWIPLLTKSINYIWANKVPKGSVLPNPYYGWAMMIAVRSGQKDVGRWWTESRNVYADYKTCFGTDPPKAGAIAIMTDTDNTGESTTAYYDDLKIERSP